jgi:hypothetical protein
MGSKPDPNDPDNKAHGTDGGDHCTSCGGSGRDSSDPSQDCRSCGGSGKK